MFNAISWQSYWLTLAILSTGYYLTIYLLYYRNDFNIRIHRRSSPDLGTFPEVALTRERQGDSPAQPSLFEEDCSSDFQLPEGGSAEAVVYNCMDELTAFFVEAKRRKWAKEELVRALRGILLKYPSLKNSSYRESLSNVIVTQCEHHCSIHLSAEDKVRVW